MEKREELDCADSCLNKARDNELIFVLLERDLAAATTVKFWIHERIRLGKNTTEDEKIKEAMNWVLEVQSRQIHNLQTELERLQAKLNSISE